MAPGEAVLIGAGILGRRRYERQGVLVEEAAMERAETKCLAGTDARGAQRIRAEERRQQFDHTLAQQIASAILELFTLSGGAGARPWPSTPESVAAAGSDGQRQAARWTLAPLPPP